MTISISAVLTTVSGKQGKCVRARQKSRPFLRIQLHSSRLKIEMASKDEINFFSDYFRKKSKRALWPQEPGTGIRVTISKTSKVRKSTETSRLRHPKTAVLTNATIIFVIKICFIDSYRD